MAEPDVAQPPSRAASPGAAVALVLGYAAIIILPLIVAGVVGGRVDEPFARTLGKSFALVGTAILAMQMVLITRWRALTAPFGLEMVMRFHKSMAVLAVAMLVMHPVLLALASGGWGLITGLKQPWFIWFGKIALLLLLIQGVTSLWQRRIVQFQRWRIIHNVAPIILVLGFTHSWIVGDDLELTPMRVLWIALLGTALVAYGLHKFVGPAWRRARAWTVKSVRQETHDTWTVDFEPPRAQPTPSFAPGQFHFVTLYRGGDRYDGEEHHFTISSSPAVGPERSSTIKHSGDFTATIGATRPGDRAVIQGPYGRFSYTLCAPDQRYLFIAGGIGITPLMGMLRHMRDLGLPIEVLLLYGNRTEDDIVFRAELDQIAAGEAPRLEIVHVLSEPTEGWTGETGYVDRDLLARSIGGDLSGRSVFLCGPDPMMNALIPVLIDMNVPETRLYTERFWL